MEDLSETFGTEKENVGGKKNQTEMKNSLSETKNILEQYQLQKGEEAEEQISNLEDRVMEHNQP